MKTLLLIAILTLVGCSTEQQEESGEILNCDCGTVIYKAYLPNGGVILRLKNDCDNNIVELEFPNNVPYNLNDTYCYGM
jgi:hypothetical protein